MAKAKVTEQPEVGLEETGDNIEQLKSLLLEVADRAGLELTPEQMELTYTDWNEKVRENGVIDIDGTKFITLAELRRLARLRGYISSKPNVVQAPDYVNHRQTTVEWEIIWRDGTIDGAAADASWRTCNPGFRNFTVPIASNRAEARCIRAALGIETCSFEEVGPEDEDLSGPANDQQKPAITALIARYKLTQDQMVELFGDELAAEIFVNGTTKLTHQQAVKAMAALNKYKPKKEK
jgi:hypothetical protein